MDIYFRQGVREMVRGVKDELLKFRKLLHRLYEGVRAVLCTCAEIATNFLRWAAHSRRMRKIHQELPTNAASASPAQSAWLLHQATRQMDQKLRQSNQFPPSCPFQQALAAKDLITDHVTHHVTDQPQTTLHVRPGDAPSKSARAREIEAVEMDQEMVREKIRVPLRSLVGLTTTVQNLTRQVRTLDKRLTEVEEAYIKGPPGTSVYEQLHIRRQVQEFRKQDGAAGV
jgi:hypothetical protein